MKYIFMQINTDKIKYMYVYTTLVNIGLSPTKQ